MTTVHATEPTDGPPHREVTVLRLGHRPGRDARVTTHVALTARALGARRFLLAAHDPGVLSSIQAVVDRFGGPFEARQVEHWRPALKAFDGCKVHLTMYGEDLDAGAGKVPADDALMVVVGAEKVPREVYDLVDVNIAVGNQPHSEVAALALLLYRTEGPQALKRPFTGGEVRIHPSERGKDVRPLGPQGPHDPR